MADTPGNTIRQKAAALLLLCACAAVPVLLLAWGRTGGPAPHVETAPDTGLLPPEAARWDVDLDRTSAGYLMGAFFDELAGTEQAPGRPGLEPPRVLTAPQHAPLFVTAYRPGTRPMLVPVREPDLLSGVRRAARAIRAQVGEADPAAFRVRLDVLTVAAPLPLAQRLAFFARGFGRPEGLALKGKGIPSFFLPAEIVDYRAHDNESMATVLCRQAGVDPKRLSSEDLDLWRLEARGFVNEAPGSRYALESDRGLTPIGEPNLTRMLRAAKLAADYLVGVQGEPGSFLTFWDVSSGLKGGCDSLTEQAGAAAALGTFGAMRPEHQYLSADYSAVSYAMSFTETDKLKPDMAFTRRQEVCHVVWELEATAGVLEAVCRFRQATARTDVDPWISALAEFILFMQRDDGLCDMQFDAESRTRARPAAARGVVPQAKAALGLLLAYRELQLPRYLVAARRLLDALEAEPSPEGGYSATEARWLVSALRELSECTDDASCAERVARIAGERRALQLLPADAPAPDLAGGSLGAFPPAAAATADDLIVFAAACEMGAGDAAANRESARLAAGYLMRLQFLTENSYYLSDPSEGQGGFREQPGSNIVRLPTMDAALRGLTMLAGIEMRSLAHD